MDIKILTPISHLFLDKNSAEDIIANSDFLEARERTAQLDFKSTTHYHIDFDLNIGLTEKQIEFLEIYVKPRENIRTLTFQASRDCEKTIIKEGVYYPDSKILSLKDQIENTKNSIVKIENIIGTERLIGIENNNFYPSGAYEICTSTEYLESIINLNNCHLLFDIAHAIVTCSNKSIPFMKYSKKLLSTEKCFQMHLCQPSYLFEYGKIIAKDAHNIPSFELTELSISLCKKYGIDFLTIEYYKKAENLVSYLKFLKDYILNYE